MFATKAESIRTLPTGRN